MFAQSDSRNHSALFGGTVLIELSFLSSNRAIREISIIVKDVESKQNFQTIAKKNILELCVTLV